MTEPTTPPLAPGSKIKIPAGVPFLFADGRAVFDHFIIASVAEVEWANLVRKCVARLQSIQTSLTPENVDVIVSRIDRLDEAMDAMFLKAQAWNEWGSGQ